MICDDCYREIKANLDKRRADDSLIYEADGDDECRDAYDGYHSPARCIDGGENGEHCSGPVELACSPGGRSWPRCSKHAEERWERYENSMERYADSDVVPDWFDPADAGEVWFEEDY